MNIGELAVRNSAEMMQSICILAHNICNPERMQGARPKGQIR